MVIGGLLKNSLLDYPGRPAVVLFTQGCGWRCPYCHNGQLIPPQAPEPISPEAVFTLLETHPPGTRNLVVSGGEPTLQPGLIEFLKQARAKGIHIKLDTNGSRPEVLEKILREKLVDYIALDVKGPLRRYGEFCGVDIRPGNVAKSISILRHCKIPYEYRTTIVPALHTVEDINTIGRHLKGGRLLMLQAFRAPNANAEELRHSEEPTPQFMEACKQEAAKWLPTEVR